MKQILGIRFSEFGQVFPCVCDISGTPSEITAEESCVMLQNLLPGLPEVLFWNWPEPSTLVAATEADNAADMETTGADQAVVILENTAETGGADAEGEGPEGQAAPLYRHGPARRPAPAPFGTAEEKECGTACGGQCEENHGKSCCGQAPAFFPPNLLDGAPLPGRSGPGLALGQGIMVSTEHGPNLGYVVWGLPPEHEIDPARLEKLSQEGGERPVPLPHGRPANAQEMERAGENALLARAALQYCRACISQRQLDMKLVDVEVLFDHSKMLFYFTAPTRIDFRELVKDLVRQYRTRIELRQIGVRHETQMLGAVGNCGMVCCCRRYLRKFAPVTIKMAKEQNLFLNPAKISGICGRLLCCLSYEQENYDVFHRSCPKLGKRYQTSAGPLRVLRANMFRNTIMVLPDGEPEKEMTLEEWAAINPRRPEGGPLQERSSAEDGDDEDLRKLEAAEQEAPERPRRPVKSYKKPGSQSNIPGNADKGTISEPQE